MMSHHKAPHREWTPDEKHRKQFEGKHIPEPENLRDEFSGRTDALHEQKEMVFKDLNRSDLKLTPPPELAACARQGQDAVYSPVGECGKTLQAWLSEKPMDVEIEVDGAKKTLTGRELEDWKYQRYMQDYLACVQSIDDNVGRLLDWLDANGLRESTVVIYTSDQGFFLGDHGLFDKRFMYEESLRMPFLVRWPAGIPAGSTSDALGINCDFAPTFLALAGVQTSKDMQGRSFLPIWKGRKPENWRHAMYYHYYDEGGPHFVAAQYGIRTETHKLIYFWKKDQWECYDLIADPKEMHNIYNDPNSQKIVAKLKEELYRLKKELKDNDQFTQQLPEGSSYVEPPPRKKH
jgi:arylsulfatase A-like enzyme